MRVLRLLLTVLLVWLGAVQGSAALAASPSSVDHYSYSSHHQAAMLTEAVTERGPPTIYGHTVHDAVDHRSHSAFARPQAKTTPRAYTYDHPGLVVQATQVPAAIRDQVHRAAGNLSSLERSGVAAKSVDEGVDLYRHVSPDELADIGENGFRAGAGSLDGKWFAESGEHASEWGRVLDGGNGSVVKVRVPTSFGNQLMRLEKLDGIGPARYVEPHQLAELNRYGWESW